MEIIKEPLTQILTSTKVLSPNNLVHKTIKKIQKVEAHKHVFLKIEVEKINYIYYLELYPTPGLFRVLVPKERTQQQTSFFL